MFTSSSILTLGVCRDRSDPLAHPRPGATDARGVRPRGLHRIQACGAQALRAGAPRHPAIIVLHGGLGVPDLAANAAVFGPLTATGTDVYLYAHLGTSDSTRLPDPRGYGRDRDAADLEALRRRLGLAQVVLIGHSYGGALAAAYLAAHPDHVAAMVLISPAPLDPGDHSPGQVTTRLGAAQRFALYAQLAQPRALLGYGLLQIHPAAARRLLPDTEADARNDIIVTLTEPALHCPGNLSRQPRCPAAGRRDRLLRHAVPAVSHCAHPRRSLRSAPRAIDPHADHQRVV